MEAFIDEAVRLYNLNIFNCTASLVETTNMRANGKDKAAAPAVAGKAKSGGDMKTALERYKKMFPSVSAILMGTRRTDPHGGELAAHGIRARLDADLAC